MDTSIVLIPHHLFLFLLSVTYVMLSIIPYLSKLSLFSFSISRCFRVSMNHFYIYNYLEMADNIPCVMRSFCSTADMKYKIIGSIWLLLAALFFFFLWKNTVCKWSSIQFLRQARTYIYTNEWMNALLIDVCIDDSSNR